MIKKLIFSLILLLPLRLVAQNNTLTGNIYDFENRTINLQGATVKNLNTKSMSITDKDGHFAIGAKIGDLISFGMVGYHTDTVYLTSLFPKNVYLRSQTTELKAVDIAATKVSPYLNTKDPNAMPVRRTEYSKERGGLRLNLGYGKYRRQQAKIQELEERDQYLEEINNHFNEDAIRSVIKFEGPNIKDFIQLYRPTVEQVKSERPFNYALHIARSYRSWTQLPPDQRKLQPLIKLKN